MTLKYEAILFDFDGVLVDSEPVHMSCWNQLLSENFGYTVAWEDFAPNCVGVHERGTVEWLVAQRHPPVPFADLWDLYPRKKQLFRERMLLSGSVDDDVIDLLKELRNDYLLAVVTSSGRVEVEPILESAGILPLIQTAVYGSDVTNLKPAPDPYLLACRRIGTSNALVIEDSAAGVASGKAAGLDVLQITSQREVGPTLRAHLAQSGS
ncbi:MAG: HAD family phosphatase [Bryobacteraceae bacterium]|nr:HAD family phosphatase [Bryobacteraceae bacterium]